MQEQQEPVVQAKCLNNSHFKKLYGGENVDRALLQHEVLFVYVIRISIQKHVLYIDWLFNASFTTLCSAQSLAEMEIHRELHLCIINAGSAYVSELYTHRNEDLSN